MDNLKIFVACHKPFNMVVTDNCFQPIHVGAKNSSIKIEGAIGDDTGLSISDKNPIYCELTGLYWVWKNCQDIEYVGLCHYRRFFAKNAFSIKNDYSILNGECLLKEIEGYDIILPQESIKKEGNHYYINDCDYENDRVFIEITTAIKELYPEYLQAAIEVLKSKRMSFGNIMLSNKKVFDKYCDWLFSIEFYLEEFIESKFGSIDSREMGFISEWLLNIWVKHNKLNVKYLPVCMINDDSKYVRMIKQLKQKLM